MPLYQLTSVWQKVASAGQTVEVENLSDADAVIMTSTGGAPATLDGVLLFSTHISEQLALTQDLYARALNSAVTLEVMGGFSLGGSGTTTGSSSSATTSMPGGGPNNTADFSDPNNAYLAALMMTA